MRTVVLVQSRVGSARLPGKALLPLLGRPMLDHVLERALAIGADEVVLATTDQPRDQPLVAIGAARGVRTYCGSESDVLLRMCEAARLVDADVVVRVTGDCPLLCPRTARLVVETYHTMVPGGYAWNDTTNSGYPDGTDVEVFARELLERAEAETWRNDDMTTRGGNLRLVAREHVTSYVRMIAPRTATIRPGALNLTRLKLSVDRREDYEAVRRIMAHLPTGALALPATVEACYAAGILGRES